MFSDVCRRHMGKKKKKKNLRRREGGCVRYIRRRTFDGVTAESVSFSSVVLLMLLFFHIFIASSTNRYQL